uniref:methionine--tRNA ligase n=1 Tax=Ndongobacter massiliensis TaxID=1871025 RepID=UPI000930041F|nr:methionine--tRNA ligase [Ndongobacter massiliensis]
MCNNHKKESYYITAPIYYPSANLHLGNTYTSIICDTVRRYKRACGYDAYYVTGSDEHGEKLAKVAQEHGKAPLDYINPIVQSMKDLWALLDVEPDTFVRSTSDQHAKDVQKIFQKLYDKGDIYKAVYKGHYCTPCESFWTESQLVDGNCPDCGRPTYYREEESYFFRLSKYQEPLLQYYREHPDFIKPDVREKELIGSFFKEGLEDLSVSRTRIDWGVPVPFDPKHVIYVWVDALICYLTGIGYGTDPEKFDRYWNHVTHFVGRDIARFHAIIWPALLMAAELPLPKQIFAHGWILFDEDKMSKSKGNIIYPEPIVELYGRDALKYFILREFSFGSDGNFSSEKFLRRINSDLANDLGNLLSRSVAMVEKYNGGKAPAPQTPTAFDESLLDLQKKTRAMIDHALEDFDFQQAFEHLWALIRRTNKYIDETTPWVLEKEGRKAELDTVLYRLLDALRTIATLLDPFLPETSVKMFAQLGIEKQAWEQASEVNTYPAGTEIFKGEALFPRLDVEKELKRFHAVNNALIAKRMGITLEELEARQKANVEAKESAEKESKESAPVQEAQASADGGAKSEESVTTPISFEDFEKVQMRVGEIIDCKVHPDADRLFIETVDFGDEVRTIVSGLRGYYEPEDLIGKKAVFVVNLAPRKIRGVESNGMILAAESDSGDTLSLLTPLSEIPKGAYLR